MLVEAKRKVSRWKQMHNKCDKRQGRTNQPPVQAIVLFMFVFFMQNKLLDMESAA